MDYNRPLTEENSPKVHIALVLAPGAHSGPKKFSTSPLLINPGGPGGSGTTFALAAAEPLRTILGDPEQDIIGFDPRGIAATTPRADCFAYPIGLGKGGDYLDEDYITGNYHRMLWQNSGVEIGHVNSSSDSLLKLVARAKSVAKLCQEKDDVYGNESILRHAHTPNVARDMISIIDAWDEWTNSTSRKPNPCNKEKISVPITSENTSVFSTKSKLVYWGFSYGVSGVFLIVYRTTNLSLDVTGSDVRCNVPGSGWSYCPWLVLPTDTLRVHHDTSAIAYPSQMV